MSYDYFVRQKRLSNFGYVLLECEERNRPTTSSYKTLAECNFFLNLKSVKYVELIIIYPVLKAYHRVKFYSEILSNKLKARGMDDDSQLMSIQNNLEAEAKAHLGKR